MSAIGAGCTRGDDGKMKRSLLGSDLYGLEGLVGFFADLFSGALSGQRFFHAALLTRLQVIGVTFHFLDDVFRLHLALEAAQGVLYGFTLLQSNFCQIESPPNLEKWNTCKFTSFLARRRRLSEAKSLSAIDGPWFMKVAHCRETSCLDSSLFPEF